MCKFDCLLNQLKFSQDDQVAVFLIVFAVLMEVVTKKYQKFGHTVFIWVWTGKALLTIEMIKVGVKL